MIIMIVQMHALKYACESTHVEYNYFIQMNPEYSNTKITSELPFIVNSKIYLLFWFEIKKIVYKHSNRKPYICFECGFSTKIPQTLKRHSKIHTRGESSAPELMNLRGREEEKEKSAETENIYIKCKF